MTTLIERAWERVRDADDNAAHIRVDPEHPGDIFAARDAEGQLGLLLLLDGPPPKPPRLEAVQVVVGERADGRWSMGIYLTAAMLLPPFTQLCDDLIESSRSVPADRIGLFVVGRLRRWQDLLSEARSGMSLSRLRGLVGELLFLRAAMATYGAVDAVEGWAGPYSAPQDFALPGLWVEVKATFPTARAVRISSADQLAAPGRLLLAVYSLATLLPHEPGISAGALVLEIESRLRRNGLEEVAVNFGKRLSATGFERTAEYSSMQFREDALHFFEVQGDFPRIRPSDLAPGIDAVAYDLDLGALSPFETESPVLGGHGPH